MMANGPHQERDGPPKCGDEREDENLTVKEVLLNESI